MGFNKNYWALILGGSSGFGLATAQKLSEHGMNICIVHRDRKGNMPRIQPMFDAVKANGVEIVTYNVNALAQDEMEKVLLDLKEKMGANGRIHMMLHSIAYGNLKLLAPEESPGENPNADLMKQLSESLGIEAEVLQSKVDELFHEGAAALAGIASPAKYDNQNFLEEEDFTLTVHSMGTSLAMWVRGVFQYQLFADDARVLALTSEGNEISWKGYAAVSAAKVALEAVARAIAVEYAPYGIRANIIQAGVTDTPALRLIPGSTHLKASAVTRNPYKRLTTPKDVANFIYLMCQDEAAWVNGNIIRVDGGEHISG
jgi:NAD(P)-dependent dehydrogenase (short-subunit alcohol dehydrogenase family)